MLPLREDDLSDVLFLFFTFMSVCLRLRRALNTDKIKYRSYQKKPDLGWPKALSGQFAASFQRHEVIKLLLGVQRRGRDRQERSHTQTKLKAKTGGLKR